MFGRLETARNAYNKFLNENPDIKNTDYTEGEEDQEFLFYHNKNALPVDEVLDGDIYYISNNVDVDLTGQLISNKNTGKVIYRVELDTAAFINRFVFYGIAGYTGGVSERDSNRPYSIEIPYESISDAFTTSRILFSLRDGEYDEKVTLTASLLDAGNRDNILAKKSLNFAITKTGYKKPKVGPEYVLGEDGTLIDGGKSNSEGKIIDDENIKDFSFRNILTPDTYFLGDSDRILFIGKPDPISLNSVEIVIDIPDFEGNYARFLENKDGISFYEDKENNQLILKLMAASGKDLKIENGDIYIGEHNLGKAFSVKNAVYDGQDGLYYLDENGNSHKVESDNTYIDIKDLEGESTGYKLEGNKILDAAGNEIGEFVNNKIVKDGKTLKYENGKFDETEDAPYYEIIDGKIVEYTKVYSPLEEDVIVDDEGNIQKEVVVVDAPSLTKKDEDVNKYYGTILKDEVKPVFSEDNYYIPGAVWRENKVLDETGKVTDIEAKVNDDGSVTINGKTFSKEDLKKSFTIDGEIYRYVEKAGFTEDGYEIKNSKLRESDGSDIFLIDRFGKLVDYVVLSEENGVYTVTDKKNSENKVDGFGTTTEKIFVGQDNVIIDDLSVAKKGEYVVDENDIVYSETGKTKLNGKYVDVKQVFNLVRVITYKDGEETKKVINPETTIAPFELEEDKNYIIQIKGDDVVLLDADKYTIQGLVNSTPVRFEFPGFRTGETVYHIYDTTWKATYLDPETNEEKSIFVDEISTHDVFRLKGPVYSQGFNKLPPSEFRNPMDYELFNMFYRRTDDKDKDRAQIIRDYLDEKELSEEEEEFAKSIIDKLKQKGITIEKAEDVDKAFKELEWTLVYTNNGHSKYPQAGESQLVFHDSNMDNRLVFSNLVFNAPKSDLLEIDKDKIDDTLFSIDEIDKIRFGVNPYLKKLDFVLPTDGFVLPSDRIMAAFNAIKDKAVDEKYKEWLELTGEKAYIIQRQNGLNIRVGVSYNEENGRVSLDVFDYFYQEKAEESEEDSEPFSPVLEQYNDDWGEINNAKTIGDLKKSVSNTFKEAECGKAILEEIKKISDNDSDPVPESIKKYLKTIELDENTTTPYNKYNRAFNAFQIVFNKGVGVEAGESKKVIVTSVIAPNVEVPFTDEYGKLLTTREMFFNRKLANMLQADGKTFKEEYFDGKEYSKLNDAELRDLYAYINGELDNPLIEESIKIENLVDENFNPVIGSKLENKSNNLYLVDPSGKILLDRFGNPINPNLLIIGDEVKYASELFGSESEEANSPINLIAYYMHKYGYNRAEFYNSAAEFIEGMYKSIDFFDEGESWRNEECFLGIIGHCIVDEGSTPGGGIGGPSEDDEDRELTSAKITITYPNTTPKTPDEEEKIEKNLIEDDKEGLYMPNDDIGFVVKVKIVKHDLKTALKQAAIEKQEPLSEDEEDKIKSKFNKNGYILVKNGVIIDFLPDELEFKEDTTIKFVVKNLNAGGANKDIDNEKFLDGVTIIRVDSFLEYYNSLPKGELKEMLASKINPNEYDKSLRKAIIVLLPDFEAPSENYSGNLFELSIDKLKVTEGVWDEKTNTASFAHDHEVLFDDETFIIGSPAAERNKYVRYYDKEVASEWFRGTIPVDFGQKFDYKLEYESKGIALSNVRIVDLTITDELPQIKNGQGIQPYLLGPVEIEVDVLSGAEFEIKYTVDGRIMTKKDMVDEDYRKVTRIEIIQKSGTIAPKDKVSFILYMQVPTITLKVDEEGNIVFDEDGNPDYENLDLFDFSNLLAKNKYEYFGKESNEVKIKIEDTFIHLLKLWEKDGKILKGEVLKEMPPVNFDIYRIKNGDIRTREKITTVTLNNENSWNKLITKLKQSYKEVEYKLDGNGNIIEDKTITTEVAYSYIIQEVGLPRGYEVTIVDVNSEGAIGKLGMFLVATNKEKPETPYTPEEPPETPEEPPVIPPIPEEPPVIPEEPPVVPEIPEVPLTPATPEVPEEPPVPRPPTRPGEAPRTFDEGIGIFGLMGIVSLIGIVFLERKKKIER